MLIHCFGNDYAAWMVYLLGEIAIPVSCLFLLFVELNLT